MQQTTWQVRPATAADVPQIVELERQAPTASHWTREQYEVLFRKAKADGGPGRIVLVVEDAVIEGFLIASGKNREWEIENMVVSEAKRRRGLGTLLVKEVLKLAERHNAEAVFLEVRESNRAAQALYEKCGFAEIGRRKAYYGQPVEDALNYRHFLK